MLHTLNKALKLPEISIEQALAVIASELALAKTLVHERDKPTNLLNQLADPVNIRPVRDTTETLYRDREFVYNPKTGQSYRRNINKKRGTPKATGYPYTKKTATTLLPTNGIMSLYRTYDARDIHRVGMIFNLQHCHLKDGKYIFENNAKTHSKFWVGRNYATDTLPRAVTLGRLTALNREKARHYGIDNNNEILAGLSKQSVTAVFATENDVMHRLNALVMQDQVRKTLGIVVPILIINGIYEATTYNQEQQIEDLKYITTQNPLYIRDNFSLDLATHIEKNLGIRRPNYNINQAIIDLQDSLENNTLQLTLDMFDFVQLTNVMYELEHNRKKPADLALKAALLPEYKKRKKLDLAELRVLLNSRFHISSIESMNRNDFYIDDLSESTKSRLIIHLSYLNPSTLAPIMCDYMYNEVIGVLQIKYFPSQMIQRYHKVVLAPPEGSYLHYATHQSIHMSPLTIKIMNHKKSDTDQLIQLIIRHHAQHIESILQNLIELETFSRKYGKDCIYSSNTIEKAIHAIALEIESVLPYVSSSTLTAFDEMLANNLSHDKRRILETTLLSQANRLMTREEVYSFYRDHGDTLALIHQRHSNHGLFPQIKVNVLTTLQNRLAQISNTDHTSIFVEHETVELKAELARLLEDKKSKLRETSVVNFFSSHSALEKIRKIDETIDRLKPIRSLDELRFFVATLMIDDDLVRRRTFGCGLSDTAVKLENFYQQAFIKSEQSALTL